MSINSEELINTRKNEIVKACAELYKTKSFKNITIKDIGSITPFTRTSIYNYFQTKEEIFLSLLKSEYQLWIEDLNMIISSNDILSKEELSHEIAKSLEKRVNLLKLISMNLYDIEENSRLEHLVEFKVVYGKSIETVGKCIDKFCADMNTSQKDEFIYLFFPLIFGIYPYAVITEKQCKAMSLANIDFKSTSIYDIAYNGILKLLK